MPRIDDTSILKKKPFKKKSYRPWNLLDDNLLTTKNEVIHTNNTNIKTGHKPDTNRTQIEHKQDTNRAQTGHIQNKDFIETEHKSDTKSDTKSNSNRTQIEHKQDTKHQYPSLVGLQRKLLIFLIEDCKNTRSRITQEMSLEHIAENLKVPIGGLKTTLRRLEKKKFIRIIEFKIGRGGWRKYEIPDDVYKELLRLHLEYKSSTNRTQIEHKPDTKPDTQWDTTSSSSSSKEILNTTTTDVTLSAGLPTEWEEVDLKELQKRGVHFSKNHIVNLWEFLKVHSAFEFQESIDGYVYDIDNNHVQTRRGYLNLLIGTIRNSQLYISSHYVSPEMKKINEMIELNRKRKAELDSFYRAKEEEGFFQWMDEYGRENIKKQLPVNLMIDFEHKGKTSLAWIKQHLYPKVKNES
jgi:hypothetical protein